MLGDLCCCEYYWRQPVRIETDKREFSILLIFVIVVLTKDAERLIILFAIGFQKPGNLGRGLIHMLCLHGARHPLWTYCISKYTLLFDRFESRIN